MASPRRPRRPRRPRLPSRHLMNGYGPALGNPENTLRFDFEPGFVENGKTMEDFRDHSPTMLVLYLARNFFQSLIDRSNAVEPAVNLCMRDMLFLYHAALTLGVYMKGVPMYGLWELQHLFEFTGAADDLTTLLPASLPIQVYSFEVKRLPA